jgi:hypothetical protein
VTVETGSLDVLLTVGVEEEPIESLRIGDEWRTVSSPSGSG